MIEISPLDTFPVTTIKYSNDKTDRRCFIVLPHVHVDTTAENDSSLLSKSVAATGGSVTLDVQCMWLNELDGLYEYMEDITHDLEDAPSWRVILMDDDDLETASSVLSADSVEEAEKRLLVAYVRAIRAFDGDLIEVPTSEEGALWLPDGDGFAE
jgi:hypothetical protein